MPTTPTIDELALAATYTAIGFAGHTFRVLGYATAQHDIQELRCPDEDHEHDEWCFTVEVQSLRSDDVVLVSLNGDGTRHQVPITDLIKLSDTDQL